MLATQGLGALLRLREAGFQLGVFSSSTARTAEKAAARIAAQLGLGMGGRAAAGAAEAAPLFAAMLHRDHCVAEPYRNGKSWDTVKPLGKVRARPVRCSGACGGGFPAGLTANP